MNILLWILQGLLAILFLMAGFMKLSKRREDLLQNERMQWAKDVSATNIKIIGFLEVLGAIGLVIPLLIDVLPLLTLFSALGLVLVMASSIILHLKRKDGSQSILPNFVIMLIAAFVVVGRFELLPL